MTTVNVDRQIVLCANETQRMYFRIHDADSFGFLTEVKIDGPTQPWLTKAEVQAIVAKISAAIEGGL